MKETAVRQRTTADEAGAQRGFTADEYCRMAEAGILREDEQLELIEGRILTMVPIGGRHVSSVTRLTLLVAKHLPEGWLPSVQSPVRLGDRSVPEPDLAIVRDRPYGRALPGQDDVLLVIEVAETFLGYDRSVKAPAVCRRRHRGGLGGRRGRSRH